MNDIYTERAWPYLLRKYPKLNDLCMEYGIRTPQGAKVFRDEHKFDLDNKSAFELSTLLYAINFNECFFHEAVINKLNESYEVGAYDDSNISLELLISELEEVYSYFKEYCYEIGVVISTTPYDELLRSFTNLLILKEGYEDIYIKYFNRRLIDDGYELNIPDIEVSKAKRLIKTDK